MTTSDPASVAHPALTVDSPPATLLDAVNELTATTRDLTEKLAVSERLRTRQRRLGIAVGLIFVLFGAFGIYQFHRVSDTAAEAHHAAIVAQAASKANHENVVQNCENTNDSRAASLSLWTTVIQLTQAGAGPATSSTLDNLLGWVAVLYQPHDCDHLNKVYDIPTFAEYVASLK